jgi:nucleoside-diphosphate-sugar epimerase
MSTSPVLVTGANGFIGAHCIAALLHSNHRVRATVRSSAKAAATIEALAAAGVPNLANLETAVLEDPTDVSALAKTLPGCGSILHLASAFNYDARPGEFEDKLLHPAIAGTRAVVQAAATVPGVKRVVVMSSFASVYDASLGLQPGRVYTEKDWSPLGYEEGRDADHVVCAFACLPVLLCPVVEYNAANEARPPHTAPRKSSPKKQPGISSATTPFPTRSSRCVRAWSLGK